MKSFEICKVLVQDALAIAEDFQMLVQRSAKPEAHMLGLVHETL